MVFWLRVALFSAMCWGLLGAPVLAQGLPRPAEFYFDEDRSATRVFDVASEADATEARVNRLLRDIPRDIRALNGLVQIARLAMQQERYELGTALYQRVVDSIDRNHTLYRSVLWNYGWDLHRAGMHEEALQQWTHLINLRQVRASWIPPTLALALWQSNRQGEAVQWYGAAVRTEPGLWGVGADLEAMLPDWSAADRAVLQQVKQAWANDPPMWP